jgi:hypothetical protein
MNECRGQLSGTKQHYFCQKSLHLRIGLVLVRSVVFSGKVSVRVGKYGELGWIDPLLLLGDVRLSSTYYY